MKKAFFLDRDGTVNVEVNYLHEPDKCILLPKVAEAVRTIHQAGYLAIIVTNQAGVARKMYSQEDIYAVNARLQNMLLEYGADATADGWFFCPHHPDFTGACPCRKPASGMLTQAADVFDICLQDSFMIGDRMSDLRAGVNAGCAGEVLVLSGYGINEKEKAAAENFMIAEDLLDAVQKMLRGKRK